MPLRRLEHQAMLKRLADASLLGSVPEDAGPRAMTFRGGAVHSVRSPGSQEFVSSGHCIAVMLAPSAGISAAFGSEPLRTFDAETGMIAVSPAGLRSRLIWTSRRENVVVAISPESMADLAANELGSVDLELRPTTRIVDLTALQFAKLIRSELNSPGHSSELYLDSLITLLGVHVLRKYSNIAKPLGSVKAGLSATAAVRVRDYLHEHFRRKLSIAELAKICGLSPGHFAHSFTVTFGVPPHRYLLERRLDFAEKLLRETASTIPEVAFLSGFSSQSHLTNMMRVHRGKTPSRLR
jgi:AraC family transcriptional regulator